MIDRESMNKILDKYGLYLAMLVALLLALWLQGPRLFNPYAVEEDFRRHHWLDGFTEADIFEEDPAVGSFVFRLDTPAGQLVLDRRSPLYGLIFQLGGKFIPIVLISKLLVFPLLLSATYYAYRIAERVKGRRVALALALVFVIINLASNTMSSTIGGLQRSFTAPLCLALIYYLMRKMDWRAALVILISGLIYAPVFLIGVLMYGMSLVQRVDGRWRLVWRRLLPLMLAIGLVTLFLLPLLQLGGGETSAAAGGRLAFLADPALQPDGRHALFSYFPLIGHGGLTLKGVDIIHTILFFSFLIVFWFLDRQSLVTLPASLKHFLFASVLGYLLAWLTAIAASSFILYFPSRYTQATLLLFGLLAFMLNVGEMTTKAASLIRQQGQQMHKIVLPVALLGFALVLFLPEADGQLGIGRGTGRYLILALSLSLLALTVLLRRRQPIPAGQPAPARPLPAWLRHGLALLLFAAALLYVDFIQWPFYVATADEIALFQFLEQTPADSLLAGSPCVLDSVPMFAGRTVLFSCEQIHPDNEVMVAAMAAYYSDQAADLVTFCQDYEIDLLVVDRGDFGDRTVQSGHYLFEPIDGRLRPDVQTRTEFVLRDLPATYQLFSAGVYYVASCDSFTTLAAAQ